MKWDMLGYALIGALFLYGSHIFSGKYKKGVDVIEFNLWRFIYLGLFAGLYLLFIHKKLQSDKKKIVPKDHFYIMMASIAMLVGNSVLVWLISKAGAGKVMPYVESMGAVLGIIIGYLFFNEKITLKTIVAVLLMAIGIYVYEN